MIRDATTEDLDALVSLGMQYTTLRKNGGPLIPNEEAIATTVGEMLENSNQKILVLDSPEGILGTLAVSLYRHPFSGEATAFEVFWWVNPAADAAGIRSVRLLKAAEDWATENGCTLFQTGSPKGSPVGRLYERLGFRETETMYQRRLDG